jgi:hypothetical protein
MRYITTILAICAICACSRRSTNLDNGLPGVHVKIQQHVPRIAPIALAFVSGMLYGTHETVVHHPHRIPDSWDRQWWDASVSWRNKYAGGDPRNGERFWMSTNVLAWTTDAKHLFGTTHRATLFASGVTITLGERRPAWHYLIDAGLSFVAFGVGFHTIYSSPILFK